MATRSWNFQHSSVLLIFLIRVSSLLAFSSLKCIDEKIIQVHKATNFTICRTFTDLISIRNASIFMSEKFCKEDAFLLDKSVISKPILQITNKSVNIVFKNASWHDSGLYSLKINLANGQILNRKLSITIGDVPVLPVLPSSFSQCKGIDSLCFQLPLPKKHHCSVDLKSHYWFNYTSYSKDYVHKKPIPCDIAVIDKKDTLVCKDSSLNVCKNETLSDYPLHLQIFGRNKLGYTDVVYLSLNPSITAPEHSLVVDKVKLEVLSPYEIKVFWLRPSCREIEFIYQLSYVADGVNSTQQKSYDLPDSKKNMWHKDTLKGLQPYTNYTVCLFSMRYYGDVDYREGPCARNLTSQAAPSRPPVIIDTSSYNTGKGKWTCVVRWKGVDREFWNGVIKNTVLELFDKTHRLVRELVLIQTGQSETEIKDLDISKQYLIQLKTCTNGGCISTKPKEISIERTHEKETLKKAILGVVVSLLVLATLLGIWLYRKPSRSALIKRTESRVTLPDIDMLGPRDHEPMYETVQGENEAYNYDTIPDSPDIGHQIANEAAKSECHEEPSHIFPRDSNFDEASCSGITSIPSSEYNADQESYRTSIEDVFQHNLETDPLMLHSLSRT